MKNVMNKLFLDHPASVGESYFEHLITASSFSARMILGGIACFLHGVFPFLCTKTGSKIITELHGTMVSHRVKVDDSKGCDQQVNNHQNITT